MRFVPAALAFALVLLASAPAVADHSKLHTVAENLLNGGGIVVGPCLIGYSMYWPGNTVIVHCRDYNGNEFVVVAYGTCYGGLSGATARVAGIGVTCVPHGLRDLFTIETQLP